MQSKISSKCELMENSVAYAQSNYDTQFSSKSGSEVVDLLKDASNYVESMMANQQVSAVLGTPLPNRRKGLSSALSTGESVNKKMKNVSPRSSDKSSVKKENEQSSFASKTERRTRVITRRKLSASSQKETSVSQTVQEIQQRLPKLQRPQSHLKHIKVAKAHHQTLIIRPP